ncbi:protein preY, mitochondrial [Rhinophrynus dorsalis]
MLGIVVCKSACKVIVRWPVSASSCVLPALRKQHLHSTAASRSADQQPKDSKAFDPSVLQFLVCPLSRKTLRYEESTNELINDELGIAYPVVDGIPNMIPQDARMIHKDQKPKDTEQTS